MTYEAKITIKFDSTWEYTGGIYDDEMLPEEHITMEVPAQDLNTTQLFTLFTNFARAIGHTEVSIMKGAMSTTFNDMRSFEQMKKTADEYDLVMKEDHIKEVCKLEAEVRDLKAKLSRLEQPDAPQYLDEEMEAMSAWNNLVPGTDAAYAFGCKCPILDNQEMPDNKKWVNADCPLHGKVK